MIEVPSRQLMTRPAVATLLLSLLTITSSMAGCFADDDDGSVTLRADFSYEPSTNIKVGDSVFFNASASLPQDGTLTYRWNFNGDGSVDDTGRTATWSYPLEGSYSVILTVTDGNRDDQVTKQLTVLGADAAVPTADPGTTWAEDDCDGDDGANPSNNNDRYLIYICEDKDSTDNEVDATTNILLDSSASTAGGEQAYLTQWSWDLDTKTDSDEDGIADNDDDASGETFEWTGIAPGEYELLLRVFNNEGFNDSMKFKVYVNYVGIWKDFNQPGSTSTTGNGQPGETWFEYTVVYDDDAGNTIVRAEFWLTYPIQDSDWVVGGDSEQNRNKLDIYIFNESDDEVWNTSAIPDEQRTAGECSEDDYCLQTSISRSQMRDDRYNDGEWTVKIHNDRYNDVQVVEFRILLTYK